MDSMQKKINLIIRRAKEYGAKRLILFGSAVTDPENARDIDLACDGIEGWKLFEFAGELENELMQPVDVTLLSPSNAFSSYIESHGLILI